MMSFRWTDYLALATQLAQETNEAALRSAISRAYYAAYHEAKYLADPNNEGKFSNQRGSHSALWDFYQQNSNSVYKTVGTQGDRLYKNRLKADYNVKIGELQQISLTVKDTIDKAKLIMERLDTIRKFK